MRRLLARTTLLAALAIWPAADGAAHDEPADAHFLANEAVLVIHGDIKVLFDAFYSHNYGSLLLVPEAIKAAVLAGTPPYDGVDAIFVSHDHGDHFTAAPTLTYLRAHPAVRLFAPEEATDKIRALVADPSDPVLARLVPFDLDPGDPPVTATFGPLAIDVVAVPHAGGARFKDIDNLIFRVSLGDWPTVMHLGDAGAGDAAFAPLQAHWDAKHADLALLPHWFVREEAGKTILRDRLKPGQAIAIHLPAKAVGHGPAWRARLGTDVFTDPDETREILRSP